MTLATSVNRHQLEWEVLDNFDDFPGGSDAWNNLVDSSTYPNVFRRWEWVTSWWKWFGEGRHLYLIVVTDGSETVAIVPLYSATARCGHMLPGTKLAFLGSGGPTCPEYLGPIVHRDYLEPAIREVASHLWSSSVMWDFIEFQDVPPDDVGTRALVKMLCV